MISFEFKVKVVFLLYFALTGLALTTFEGKDVELLILNIDILSNRGTRNSVQLK